MNAFYVFGNQRVNYAREKQYLDCSRHTQWCIVQPLKQCKEV